jgi:hypothetical protein
LKGKEFALVLLHSPVEVNNLYDFEKGVQLLQSLVKDLGNWGEMS